MTSDGSRYAIEDRGSERVLRVEGREHRTYYTERLIRMLIERKGVERTPLYFPFKETRGRFFLERLFAYLTTRRAAGLAVLEVGCSFGHITEYLNDQPLVATIDSFDVDPDFVEMARAKVEDLRLAKVRRLLHLTDEETTRLPFADASFDLVLAIGVVEHLAPEGRSRHVNEWWRVVAPGGHLVVLDTPNRAFPLETHSVGLPAIQWLPPRLAFAYARLARTQFRGVSFEQFDRHGAWRNAWLRECLPTGDRIGSAGRDRGGRLRLAVLPGHRALAHAARPLAPVRDGVRDAAAARTAPFAGATLFQHRAEEERGPGAPLTGAGRNPTTRRPPGC